MDNQNSYFKTTYLSDLTYIKGVGPHRAAVLKKHGLQTIQDILYYIPRKFLDRTHIDSNYLPSEDEEYMCDEQLKYFSVKLTFSCHSVMSSGVESLEPSSAIIISNK